MGRPDKAVKAVHWSRMKLFANGGFDVTERLTRTAVNDCQKFDVSSFVAWRVDDDGDIQLKADKRNIEVAKSNKRGSRRSKRNIKVVSKI